ncbi:MAG: hypothetical protein ACI8VW_001345 [bacterium]|jgi:hypothetical protein
MAAAGGLFITAAVWLGINIGVDARSTNSDPQVQLEQTTVAQDNVPSPPTENINASSQQRPEIVQRTLPLVAFPDISQDWQGQGHGLDCY